MDAFGGGACYHGGDFRLNFHHANNAGQVMNEAGANRWMYHMSKVILHKGYVERLAVVDPRALPCLVDFLELKMQLYAREYGWTFDASPFRLLRDNIKESRV